MNDLIHTQVYELSLNVTDGQMKTEKNYSFIIREHVTKDVHNKNLKLVIWK